MTKEDIKFATADDITQIVALAYKSFDDADIRQYGRAEPNFDKSLAYLTNLVEFGTVLVKRDGQKIVGFLGLMKNQPWWSNDGLMSCIIWYILPEYRTFGLAKDFISAAKECAIMDGLPLVFDFFTQKDADKKKRLLKYLKFKEIGSYCIYFP